MARSVDALFGGGAEEDPEAAADPRASTEDRPATGPETPPEADPESTPEAEPGSTPQPVPETSPSAVAEAAPEGIAAASSGDEAATDPAEEETSASAAEAPPEADPRIPPEPPSSPPPPAHPPSLAGVDLFMDVEMVPAPSDEPEQPADAPPPGGRPSDGGAGDGAAQPVRRSSASGAASRGRSGAPGPAAEAPDPEARIQELRAEVHHHIVAERPSDERAQAIRDRARALLDDREVGAVADAVERLALAAGERSAEHALTLLARSLAAGQVADLVVARLGEAHDELRRTELVRACGRLGPAVAPVLVDALPTATSRMARRSYVEALVAMGPEGANVVKRLVDDDRWYAVRNALYVMGEVADPSSVRPASRCLGHPHPRVRREALLALAKIGGDDAGQLVSSRLRDPSPEVRAAAAMAAGALRLDRARRPLLELLETEEDVDAQVAQIRALGRLGDAAAVPVLERKAQASLFSRSPSAVRIAAYRALATIGTPRAMELLESAARDRDLEVRETVREMLGRR